MINWRLFYSFPSSFSNPGCTGISEGEKTRVTLFLPLKPRSILTFHAISFIGVSDGEKDSHSDDLFFMKSPLKR